MARRNNKIRLEEESALLANERTLLSYIRTTFSALILGFALIQLSSNNRALLNIGVITIVGGIVLGLIGLIEYRLHKRRIRKEAED